MFTVKATYHGETRKLTFSDSTAFPSFTQVYDQLYRIFPLSNSYYFSKLLFSADSSPSRILISRAVHNAEDWDRCTATLAGRHFPNPLLRFSVIDETHLTLPGGFATGSSPDDTYRYSPSTSAFPSLPLFHASAARPPAAFDPFFGMDVDDQQEFSGQIAAVQPSEAQPTGVSSTQGKAEVESLIEKFKADLDTILKQTFGPECMSKTPTPPAQPDMWPPPPLPTLPRTESSQPLKFCLPCGKVFNGPSYVCTRCPAVSCIACNEYGPIICRGSTDFEYCTMQLRDSLSATSTAGLQQAVPLMATTIAPQQTPFTLPTPPMRQVHSAIAQYRPDTPPAPVVHRGILCDSCNDTPIGIRHKCLDCPDYDLCSSCISSGAASSHNPFHEFYEITEPGRVVVHDLRDRPSPVVTTTANFGPSQDSVGCLRVRQHAASCDFCDSRIHGERMKCVVCPDFDTCSACFACVREQHPGHSFVRVNDPSDYIRIASNERPMHLATCNVCAKGIFGVRYKCMHPSCPDYDLCETCESLPIAVHPVNHPMLKMKDPNTLIPTVYRAGQESAPPRVTLSEAFSEGWLRNPAVERMSSPVTPVPPPFFYGTPEPGSPEFLDSPVLYATPGNRSPAFVASPIPHHSFISRTPSPPMNIPGGLPDRVERRMVPITPPMPPAHLFTPFDTRSSSPDNRPSPSPGLPRAMPASWNDNQAVYGTLSPRDESPFSYTIPGLAFAESRSDSPASDGSHESAAPQLRLPPLSLDSSNASFNLWPRASELMHLIDSSSHNLRESITTAFKPLHPVEESPLTGQEALLSRPESTEAREMTQSNSIGPIASRIHSLAALLDNEEAASTVSLPASVPAPAPVPLSARFVNDVTVPDGQIFPPGAEFIKCWAMENNTTIPWPETTELKWVGGDRFSKDTAAVKVGAVQPGATTQLWTLSLKAPETPGRYVGYWKLVADGKQFGDNIWLDLTVSDGANTDSGESSMTSSSVIVPNIDEVKATTGALASAPSAPSTISPDSDTISDAGSEDSSISLISIPDSDSDADEAELWQDSRSTLRNTQASAVEEAEEYIVLYESSDEDD